MSKKNQGFDSSRESTSIKPNETDEYKGPWVQFARFVNGKLQLFHAHTKQEKFIAVSHVWGDKAWRFVPIAGREVLISEQKADFVQNELPDLVGDVPFWMDTLTVDQHNQAEVISTVQKSQLSFEMPGKLSQFANATGFTTVVRQRREGIIVRVSVRVWLITYGTIMTVIRMRNHTYDAFGHCKNVYCHTRYNSRPYQKIHRICSYGLP